MKKITVIYSNLCEANGAFLGQLREWLDGYDIEISATAYHEASTALKSMQGSGNCFIDVYYDGKHIDTVPLHKSKLYAALGIEKAEPASSDDDVLITETPMGELAFRHAVLRGEVEFIPITQENYLEEMTMCLCNYPFGNPPERYHAECVRIKSTVFAEVWEHESIAGVYAKYAGKVVGLLEVFPREIIRKHGYMTGSAGEDGDYLTVGCFEVGYGIPRVEMIDELMVQLGLLLKRFSRRYIEAIGVYEWNDGFQPYWVYDKYSFKRTDHINENTVVMEKMIQ